MLKRKSLVVALVGSIGVPVCLLMNHAVLGGDNPNDANQGMTTGKLMQQNFFRNAASDNTLEVRLAKLAEQKSNDPQVKQAAETMERDHEQANQLLDKIAKQNNIDVNTDDLNSVDQAELSELQSKDGDQFTHMYVFGQVGDHARDELILAYHANHSQDSACRDYASQVLPKVQMHLQMLEQIARPMAGLQGNGNAQPAAERMEPNK
jgi:putative membrane protein